MHILVRTALFFAVLFSCSTTASAQSLHLAASAPLMPDVLGPAPRVWWIGPQIGANLNMHSGDLVTSNCNCRFDEGSGSGISVGIELGHLLSPAVGIAVKALYDDFSADFSNTITELTPQEDGSEEMLDFTRELAVKLSYFTLNPMLEVFPAGGLYLMAGPGIGFRMESTQEYTKSLTDENYEFVSNDQSSIKVEKDSGEVPGAKSMRFDLRAGIGYNLQLGKRVSFSPEVSYVLPFTNISTDDNWSASAIHMMGVLKIAL